MKPILTIVALIALMVAALVWDYRSATKVCAEVTKVHQCVGRRYYTQCRVDLSDGSRHTTREIVVEGDRFCRWVR